MKKIDANYAENEIFLLIVKKAIFFYRPGDVFNTLKSEVCLMVKKELFIVCLGIFETENKIKK